jgi:peptidoglycan/LPS O-acetylase OafA/YrhL
MLLISIAIFLAGMLFGYERSPALLTWGFPSALLIAGLIFNEQNGHVPQQINTFSFLGDSSYSFYLLHIVLIDAIVLLTVRLNGSVKSQEVDFGSFWSGVITLSITVCCVTVAHLSYKFLKRRIIKSLRAWYQRKSTAAAAA